MVEIRVAYSLVNPRFRSTCFRLRVILRLPCRMSAPPSHTVLARFKSETGETVSNMVDLPRDITVNLLQMICNSVLKQVTIDRFEIDV